MTLGDSLCDTEATSDMDVLSRITEGFAKQLARAVLLEPRFLPNYLTYSTTAVLDPHSDYAVQMKRVCNRLHPEFLKAMAELPKQTQQEIVTLVIRPDDCRTLAIPEAED